MTYTGPPRPNDPHESYRQARGRGERAYGRGMRDEALLPVHIVQSLFRLVWWMAKTLFRIVRRK